MNDKLLKKLYHDYKHGASRRKLYFNLSWDFFTKIIFQNCFYCNRKPFQVYSSGLSKMTRTGIDRVENHIGYLESNCVPCCKDCNYSKRNKPFSDFIKKINNG